MDLITSQQYLPYVILLFVWATPWKGIALWKAARIGHRSWFIAILVINTFGILDIAYIFLVASKYKVETTENPEPEDKHLNSGTPS